MIEVTLVASTPQDAYELAKRRFGNDFALVSARQIRHSDDEKLSCEIKVAVSRERFLNADHLPSEEERLKEELSLLHNQIALMKQHLQGLQTKDDRLIEKVKKRFKEKGIDPHWVAGVLEPLIGSPVAEDEELLVAYLLEEIDTAIQTKQESLAGAKVMMFVGPTGVGKTTTIAKLAARYAYMMDSEYRVALVNLDSFKVGAFEQLAHYADIMQLDYFTVNNVAQFKELFARLDLYDIVLIDTAGMSPFDTRKLAKTVEYIGSDRSQSIEVVLVISATSKYEDIKDIHETFSFLNFDSLILSKFDETKHLGPVLNYLIVNPIPLSYFSVGQEVPDDLVVADKEYLLARFIGDLEYIEERNSHG